MGKSHERNPRDVDVHEIVLCYQMLIGDLEVLHPDAHEFHSVLAAEKIIDKLVGPERESEARWSSRHIVVDYTYCQKLADSLAISEDEAYDFFIGEPVKRIEKVAAWALEQADKNLAGLDKDYEDDPSSNGPMIHGQRGRMVAGMLQDWAITNHTGVYRQRQYTRQAPPAQESA